MGNIKLRPQADCHPSEPHHAKGLCKKCWAKTYRQLEHNSIRQKDYTNLQPLWAAHNLSKGKKTLK